VIREDAQQLFGFHTLRERELFRALIRVNGVGPKLALTILSGMDADAFVACVHSKDHARLTAIPGIGKKTAERLIIETQDLLKGWQATQLTPQLSHAISNSASEDALSALKALGYKPQDAKKAIDRVFSEELNSEALIRLALQTMTQGA
jgi:Holliday junction DNA helicase RuvA